MFVQNVETPRHPDGSLKSQVNMQALEEREHLGTSSARSALTHGLRSLREERAEDEVESLF